MYGYTDILKPADFAKLSVYFQQRHVLSHLDGVIDQHYIDKSQDTNQKVGQRLIVSEKSVIDLCRIVEILAEKLHAIAN